MAEFCEDCFLKYNPECAGKPLILSKDRDLCEGCGEYKRVVDGIGRRYLFSFLPLQLSRNMENKKKEK